MAIAAAAISEYGMRAAISSGGSMSKYFAASRDSAVLRNSGRYCAIWSRKPRSEVGGAGTPSLRAMTAMSATY